VSFPLTNAVPASQEFASRVWNQLSDCVDAFINAWDKATEPPTIGEFVLSEEPAVRKLILSELVKVDLEYRWRGRRFPKLIEDYLVEFPEMAESGFAPVDLVYEEYHVRRQAGDEVEPIAYFKRFPTQETELRRLLKLESPHVTTTLTSGAAKLPMNLGDRIDDFDLLTELGRGAFASVYLARQRSMQRMVALKVSADKGDEPRTLAQLDHPNIVRVYDQRQLADRKLKLLYMQYVPGGTLESASLQQLAPAERNGQQFLNAIDRELDGRGESPPSDSSTREKLSNASWPEVICWLGSKLAAALSYAHHQGVLHRDLKPANVLVAADGSPKLADFNISFASKLDGATPAAYFGGSLAYMSPEQLEACNPAHEREPDSLDGRSDVYSLGVMLWEMLAGTRPFPDEKPSNNWSALLTTMVARRTAGVELQALLRLPSNCPPGLRDVLMKCLAPDVQNRITASEAARQFEICLQPRAQQLLHAPKTAWRSIVQRHPTMTVVVAIVITHAVMSALNITFNAIQLLKDFGKNAEDIFYDRQLGIVNAVAYTTGIGSMLWLAWPVFIAVGPKPTPATPEELAEHRARCLRLGDYLAKIGITLWAASGVVIPIWLAMVAGVNEETSSKTAPIVYFLISQLLFGVIASTLSYFIMTFIAVRYFYPRLLARGLADHHEVSQLATVSRRMRFYLSIAISVPFIALILLARSETDKTLTTLLGIAGLAGGLLSFVIDRIIRDDLAALAQVVNPVGSTLASTETTDSFLTGSRTDTLKRRNDSTMTRK
jgi:serine/threonine protein kinase